MDWAFGSAASAGGMQRVAEFPDVPTAAESGGPAAFEFSAWTALLAPKRNPPVWMKPGDKVEIEVSQVGVLTIAAEAA